MEFPGPDPKKTIYLSLKEIRDLVNDFDTKPDLSTSLLGYVNGLNLVINRNKLEED